MSNEMRGLFSICMGQFGGNFPADFDPTLDTTTQWYQAFDTETYFVFACGSLEVCLKAIEKYLKTFKTREEYFKHLWSFSTEDYYLIHYKHHSPLTHDQKMKLLGSKCCSTPTNEKERKREVQERYGYYFHDMIKEVEDRVFEELEEKRTNRKLARKVAKVKKPIVKFKKSYTPTQTQAPKKPMKPMKITLLK